MHVRENGAGQPKMLAVVEESAQSSFSESGVGGAESAIHLPLRI